MPKHSKSRQQILDSDYEGWVARLITKVEDIDNAATISQWINFAADKIGAWSHKDLTRNQIDTLKEYRLKVYNIPGNLGVTHETPFKNQNIIRFRDNDGKWGKRGTWVSRDKVNVALAEHKIKWSPTELLEGEFV